MNTHPNIRASCTCHRNANASKLHSGIIFHAKLFETVSSIFINKIFDVLNSQNSFNCNYAILAPFYLLSKSSYEIYLKLNVTLLSSDIFAAGTNN